MNSKLKTVIAAMGMGLALTSLSASAGVTWYGPLTGFQDDNLDWFWNNDGSTNGLGNPTLTVGDTLISVIEINQTHSILPPGSTAGFGGQELTGIAAIDVLTQAPSGIPGLSNYTFGPHAGGLDSVLAIGGIAALPTTVAYPGGVGAPGGPALVALYLDSTPNIDLVAIDCGSLATCIAAAGDSDTGVAWQVDGFAGDLDEYWVALNAADDIAFVEASPAGDLVGAFKFAGSILVNNTGKLLFPQFCLPCSIFAPTGDGMVDVIGSGTILGGQGLVNGASARSDFDFQKAVPEPGTLALLATGLLGLGYSLRKRNG